MKVVNVAAMLNRVRSHWSPMIVGDLNGQCVKVAKLKGEFVWHDHQNEDELFLVVRGKLRIALEDGELTLGAGEFTVIPRGVRHKPIADEEVHVILFEPNTTVSTGAVVDPRATKGERL